MGILGKATEPIEPTDPTDHVAETALQALGARLDAVESKPSADAPRPTPADGGNVDGLDADGYDADSDPTAIDGDPTAEFMADGDGVPDGLFGQAGEEPPAPVAEMLAWAYGDAEPEPEPAVHQVRRTPPPPPEPEQEERPIALPAPGEYGRRRDKVRNQAPPPPKLPKPPKLPRRRQHTYAGTRNALRR